MSAAAATAADHGSSTAAVDPSTSSSQEGVSGEAGNHEGTREVEEVAGGGVPVTWPALVYNKQGDIVEVNEKVVEAVDEFRVSDSFVRQGFREQSYMYSLGVYCDKTQRTIPGDLLTFKANINVIDIELETPLAKAAKAGMVDAVDMLLAAGADCEIRNLGGHLAGDSFGSKVSSASREKNTHLLGRRREELAAEKEREREVRRSQQTAGAPRVKERKEEGGCVCCSIS